jgi:hypothetical protein
VLIGIYLLYIYARTKITEFFLFSGFFIGGAFTYLFISLAFEYDELIFYQLERIFFILTYLFLYNFLQRTRSKKPSWIASGLVHLYALMLIIFILFWELQEQPDQQTILSVAISKGGNALYHPKGAGLPDNMIITYSTSFPHLNIIFTLYIALLGVYYVNKYTPSHQTPRIRKAQKLWFVVFLLHLLYYILALTNLDLNIFVQITLFVAILIIIYVILFIPEGLILSHYQIVSVYKLYDEVDQDNMLLDDRSKNMTIEQIKEYMNSISVDLK